MLNHIEIYVSDLAASRRFYEFLLGNLGYEIYQDWEDGFSFLKAGIYLVFVQAPDYFLQKGYHRTRIGLNHLAFWIDGPLEEWHQSLLGLGVSFLYEDRYPYAGGQDSKRLYCLDPDGIKIELIQKEEY